MCVLRACIAEGVFELCWGSWCADIYSVLYISHSLSSQLWFHSLWARQLSKTSWSPYTQHAFLPSYNAWCWICTCFPGKVIWWFPNCWHTLRWWVVADELCVVRICSAIVSVPLLLVFSISLIQRKLQGSRDLLLCQRKKGLVGEHKI